MKAMILAAGLGTRMRPLTDHCPKPLLEAGGKPLVVHQIERLAAAGVVDIVINVSHLGHLIEARLGDGAAWGVRIRYSHEATPLETAGGILQALPWLGDQPFLLVNGDVWSECPLAELALPVLPVLAHLVLVPNPVHHPTGDFGLVDGQVMPRDAQRTALTFSGLSVLHPALFDPWRDKAGQAVPLGRVLLPAIQAGQVSGECFEGYWLDVGTPARLEELRARLSAAPARPIATR